ncbi:MAG TPA: DUF4190 domain-containing protein [Actinocrinis sp.]|nr:DUF4190 domain-containing protein [Actinocrinis sp.]
MSDQWGNQDRGTGPEYGQPPQNFQSGQQFPPGPGFPGAPQYPGWPGGAPYQPPVRQSNGLAIAGFILAILFWPVGLILSIFGLVRSNKIGRAGRGLAIAGIIISVVFGAGTVALVVVAAKSPAADPGCIAERSTVLTYQSALNSEESRLTTDESSHPSAVADDIGPFLSTLQQVNTGLGQAASESVHASVKSAITTLDGDIQANITLLQAAQGVNPDQADSSAGQAGQIGTDEDAVNKLCSTL